MFEFENLEVYKSADRLNLEVFKEVEQNTAIDNFLKSQWKRSSSSIILNIAEGAGRESKADKRHFFTMARGSVFESVASLNLVKGLRLINDSKYQSFYNHYEEISKMLSSLKKTLK